ncbi:hypothetical protein A8990_11723 [Paenibacillus taihuensis]|uniref:Molybdopterin-dependent oxidoreductase-like protein n=1 Tax=Paenibacillus taihuensis TaxID=1156355 RepID=A0A3D9RRT2_9BACL|nr:hypothetical protein [Paenibacillus taihuensis]REE82659.1 hypothetical protein A8990_11723 [Paenibacillus taihuensis]
MTEQSNKATMISIAYNGQEAIAVTPEDMAALAGRVFPLSERITGGAGEAFDFAEWLDAFRSQQGILQEEPLPTHLKVEAADTFEALIPWEQLKDAAVQFAVDGAPLPKGGPVRLYVPNGSSECLNVKSVIVFRLLHDEARSGEVSYGFKSTFTPDEMRLKR